MERLLSINKLLILPITSLMLCSCHSTKNYSYSYIECQNVPFEAVNIAITDYSKTLRKRKDTNNITAVHVYIAYTSTDWFYIAMRPWLPILDDNGNYHLDADKFEIDVLHEYIGRIPPSHIPTQFAEKDDVLYVWHDPQAVLTEAFIDVLTKYGLVYYRGEMMVVTTDGGDISYIFCKANYKRRYYQKVKAPFITPLPSCGCF